MTKTTTTYQNAIAVGDTVKANDGIRYEIIRVDTPEGHRANGLNNLAAMIESNGWAAEVSMKRPRGRKIYAAMVTLEGMVANVVTLF